MAATRFDPSAETSTPGAPRSGVRSRVRATLGRLGSALRGSDPPARPACDDPAAPIRTLVDPRDIYLA